MTVCAQVEAGAGLRASSVSRVSGPTRERGIALAIVVWFLAGMSLLVAGIVMSARTDTRLAQLHVARAQATSAADGAINLLLADLTDAPALVNEGAPVQRRYQVGEEMVTVHAVPDNAFVNLAVAPLNEVAAAIRVSRAVGDNDGTGLARAVIQYRDSRSQRIRFDSVEDLLGVPGLNRAAFDSLRDFVTVASPRGRRGTGAPPPANVDQKMAMLNRFSPMMRARHPELLALGSDNARIDDTPRAGLAYRVDALLRRNADVWLRRRWVSLRTGQAGFPWQFRRTEPARMVPRPVMLEGSRL